MCMFCFDQMWTCKRRRRRKNQTNLSVILKLLPSSHLSLSFSLCLPMYLSLSFGCSFVIVIGFVFVLWSVSSPHHSFAVSPSVLHCTLCLSSRLCCLTNIHLERKILLKKSKIIQFYNELFRSTEIFG